MSATAANRGFMLCDVCEMLNRARSGDCACARCGAELHARKEDSFARAWAFLIAAAVLYIPANALPVLHTGSVWGQQTDTILSGVVHLWNTNSEPLAVIVFVASIVVPAAKIVSLAFLLVMAQRRSLWSPLQRARLYRTTRSIGRWSMVDIYVGATLVALVHLGPFANIEPGPAAIPFGAVVVLTMLASMSFDPRLTWDPVDNPRG
ncbi:MAG: paraquat-inducible protein A [Burkholderiales bacterium]|nr:paraquat-inducible protein A [Burkholderiales bacterium]